MNKLSAGLALAAAGLLAAASACAADVGVSVTISEPGVYGRIDIGRFPQPQVVLAEPVWVQPVQRGYRPPPVYMWVPPGHQKNWAKHCGRYNACGVPVYFVRDDWYHQHVDRRDGPHGQPGGRDDDRGPGKHHDKGPGKGHGHGNDKGNGHGKGHGRD
ncbi:MAG: hypothetical protein ACK4PH_08075 [Aquincola tertiaricarbonis]